jgi:hypothetical protein
LVSPSSHRDTITPDLKGLSRGVAWWVAFSAAAVALRGVQWDENFEFAQAMIGAVPYPSDHPLMQYTRSAFNGQIMASAALLKLVPNPLVLNGLRNLLFVMATTVPGYLLGHVMGRRPLAGHVTAVMLLIGVHLDFDGTYPQFIWPGMFSNGHIGTGYVLAWVALTAGGYFRIAALMLGLLPAVHLGQMPPTLLFAGGLTLYAVALDRDLWAQMKPGLPWFVGGLAICAILYGIHHALILPPVTDGPYFSDADPRRIWQGRIQYWDMHRQLALGGMGMILVFSAALGVVLRKPDSSPRWSPTRSHLSPYLPLVYALGCVAPLVLTLMVLHAAAGTNVPYLLIGWLPYRLLNHLPPILTATCVAVLMARSNEEQQEAGWLAPWIPGLLLLGYLLRPVTERIVSGAVYYRYLDQPTAYLFALVGAAFFVASIRFVRSGTRDAWTIPVAAGIVILAYTAAHHQFGAACLVLGASIVAAAIRILGSTVLHRTAAPVTGLLLLITTGAILFHQWQHRENLPVGSFEREVAVYLEAQGEPNVMLAGQPEQVLLQAQTGHPVLADMATAFHASYMPSLGPSVQQLYQQVYGRRFDLPPEGQENWGRVWESRSREDWISLSETYGFEYVAAPSGLTLNLEPVVRGDLDTLFQIPGK